MEEVFLPPGWPPEVSAPGTEDWEATAVAWLLGLLPEYRRYPALSRDPVILAFVARNVLQGAVDGARHGYRTTRSELSGLIPPQAISAALKDPRAEGLRLSAPCARSNWWNGPCAGSDARCLAGGGSRES